MFWWIAFLAGVVLACGVLGACAYFEAPTTAADDEYDVSLAESLERALRKGGQ